jgi:hypothetical protein
MEQQIEINDATTPPNESPSPHAGLNPLQNMKKASRRGSPLKSYHAVQI